ncbi:hypothetical protein [Actinopolymorpha pittospori]|uniref:Uncharacterized protein n=1 Tax=Actinopolymorpha pittospori TaxID=648752 RepID=A0A927MTQ0_9ACTN|nr:hypothetical protein [Actinopolymorpha pittospori]MBE1606740.1 hypothetical protein [Actinopolymorpha pittospori]
MRVSKIAAILASSLLVVGVAAGPALAVGTATRPPSSHTASSPQTTSSTDRGAPLVAPLVTKISHAEATSRLRVAGVTWSSSGGCSNRNNPTCTSFEQVNLASIRGVITLRNASGCAVNVTGRTETGHASGTYSHWNGYKLDISQGGCVSGYITSAFSFIGDRSDGAAMYESASGNIYAREGNHWDITYYNCGGC